MNQNFLKLKLNGKQELCKTDDCCRLDSSCCKTDKGEHALVGGMWLTKRTRDKK